MPVAPSFWFAGWAENGCPVDGAGFIFAFRVLPAIIFVTALISLLYYIGVMGLLIRILGSIFQKALNISKIESFVAVTTIFLGQNEIRRSLNRLSIA